MTLMNCAKELRCPRCGEIWSWNRCRCNRRSLAYIALALLLFGAVVSAEQPALVVTDGGYFYLLVDNNGVPTLEKVQNVLTIVGDDHPGPTPPDPEDPPQPGPEPSDRVKQIANWSVLVGDFDNAQALALVYEKMADSLEAGTISTSTIWEATSTATDVVLNNPDIADRWKPFRSNLSDLVADLRSQGELKTKADILSLFRDVKTGLQRSVPEEIEQISFEYGFKVISACDAIIAKVKESK